MPRVAFQDTVQFGGKEFYYVLQNLYEKENRTAYFRKRMIGNWVEVNTGCVWTLENVAESIILFSETVASDFYPSHEIRPHDSYH